MYCITIRNYVEYIKEEINKLKTCNRFYNHKNK